MTSSASIRAWDAADAAAAVAVAGAYQRERRPIAVGLAGAQGSGKSTMAPRLAAALARQGLRAAVLSLDDFYLARADRLHLAATVHPLLATRGVPGTHDVALLRTALGAVLGGESDLGLPRFDKAADDRAPHPAPLRLGGPADIVVLEGWCVGARAQPEADLTRPVNALERDEDRDGRWRRWVNRQLAGDYAELFDSLTLRIFLRAPGFAIVERWRAEQEAQLRQPAMTAAELRRFVAHFERITRSMLDGPRAHLEIALDATRTPQL